MSLNGDLAPWMRYSVEWTFADGRVIAVEYPTLEDARRASSDPTLEPDALLCERITDYDGPAWVVG